MQYARVVMLKNNTEHVYSYKLTDETKHVRFGMRVLVPFGSNNKSTTAIVIELSDVLDIDSSKVKQIDKVIDSFPVLSELNYELAKWMSQKYFCTLSSCLRCILPSLPPAKLFSPKPMKIAESTHHLLTPAQKTAIDFILQNAGDKTLLHGVTGSGKTEIYFNLIEEMQRLKKQTILLLPEIALTTQMISLFTKRFGEKVGVTHSKMTPKQKFIQWNNARLGVIDLIIGPRSAIFTPFNNLGLVIIDEEHENTYQSETTPKYDARHIAFKLNEFGATVVLGSATPSIESYYLAKQNELKLVTLPERINKTFPEVTVVDMRNELLSGNMSIFSRELFSAMNTALNNEEQVILFINRRGFASFISCRRCGFVLSCSSCSVNYTYHATDSLLICHYCGEEIAKPIKCPNCGSKYIKEFGLGTQRVEYEIQKLFPDKHVLRMDSDTTSKKASYEEILTSFANGADILIGTQMIAKGFDFPKVTLVGVLSADLMLNTGDFRCAETTFQLLTQVTGRAGRSELKGRAVIQTYSPEHYSITLRSYEEFYKEEIALRRQQAYPPFTNFFCVMLMHTDEKLLINKINMLKETMQNENENTGNIFEILGPCPNLISKIKNEYRWRILIKHSDEEKLKAFVMSVISKFTFGNIKVSLAMNPNFMV